MFCSNNWLYHPKYNFFCLRWNCDIFFDLYISRDSAINDSVTLILQHCSLLSQHFSNCFVFFYMHLSFLNFQLWSTIDLRQQQKGQKQFLRTLLLVASKRITEKLVSPWLLHDWLHFIRRTAIYEAKLYSNYIWKSLQVEEDPKYLERLSSKQLLLQNIDYAFDLYLIYVLTLSIFPGFLSEDTGSHSLGSW